MDEQHDAPGRQSPEEALDEIARASGWRALLANGKERYSTGKSWANRTFDKYRDRTLVDVGMRLYERDRDSAGTVVSSAIAFRLFLFFVPTLLFFVGIVGFFAAKVEPKDVDKMGITGSLAQQINTALTQPSSTRWLAVLFGLLGMATTGRTLSRVLTQSSCLAWRLPVRPKAPMKVIGGIVGLLVSLALVIAIVNRIRLSLGLAIAGMSFVVALLIYTAGFLTLTAMLPRPTKDLGALLPGAALMGLTVLGLQAVSQLYLPDKFSRASELYGAIGATVVTLGWFFIVGRVVVLGLVLDAVLFERFGSITQFVFGLPIVRILPRHSAFLRRRFGLDEVPDASVDESGDAPTGASASGPVEAGEAVGGAVAQSPPEVPSEVPQA
jgi:uncharacterized BrkB/YihY/UPF0761 family membrane protein